ncbi:I78 family peptidase inhibitor [Bordetella genomosp. 9]|uniref:Peptidase inhibitor I78 family protein n=1 Tax=Bordetella genomosp. 9 TaxID=1416803 RepID=A0A1W6Z129_9BORD|nr:I78 family peptidase inhibitor [Bordetella genomosp. 9]ARP87026.1 hypothetical protein CAL13_13025 [Bordetella genomosp. 9]
MIRKLIPVILLAGLAACTTTGRQAANSPDAESPTAGTTPDSGSYGGSAYNTPFAGGRQMCDAQPVQNLIGTRLTGSVENEIKQKSSSRKTRILKPGEVMTMEYDPERINLILDQQGALTALRCG